MDCAADREKCGASDSRHDTALDNECLRERTHTEHLHLWSATLRATYESACEKRCWRDSLSCLVRGFEHCEVHRRCCYAISADGARTILTVSAELRELLDEVADDWADMVSSTRGLTLPSLAARLTALATATDMRRLLVLG